MTAEIARVVLALAVAASAFGPAGSFAQTATPDQNPPGTNAPSQFDSQARQSQRSGENLSDRLSRSNGVIKPPANTDKDIHLTPPATGDQMTVPPSANPAEKNATPK